MSMHDWQRHGDTNCGPGMVYDSPEEKEIAALQKRVRELVAERNRISELHAESQRAIDTAQERIRGLELEARAQYALLRQFMKADDIRAALAKAG